MYMHHSYMVARTCGFNHPTTKFKFGNDKNSTSLTRLSVFKTRQPNPISFTEIGHRTSTKTSMDNLGQINLCISIILDIVMSVYSVQLYV